MTVSYDILDCEQTQVQSKFRNFGIIVFFLLIFDVLRHQPTS